MCTSFTFIMPYTSVQHYNIKIFLFNLLKTKKYVGTIYKCIRISEFDKYNTLQKQPYITAWIENIENT